MVTFVVDRSTEVQKDLITVRDNAFRRGGYCYLRRIACEPKLYMAVKKRVTVYNSAKMTLEEVLEVIKEGETQRKNIVRLHTGRSPCLYSRGDQRADG